MSAPVDVMASASAFCSLVARARSTKFPGHWSGSAFRRHPCGVIEGTMKLTNDWHVDNTCSIDITDGSGWSNDYCRDSFANGNPNPKPVGGTAVRIWSNGRWVNDKFREAMEPTVRALIERISVHVEAVAEAERVVREKEDAERRAQRVAAAAAAIAKFSTALAEAKPSQEVGRG